jgi:pyruvate formate lyase activating enzyme
MRENGAEKLEKLVGRDVSAEEIMATVERDRPYYRRSDGGLTLSGGEALCQPDFALSLLAKAREAGIGTAVESSGYVEFTVIEKILPYLDQFLLDIKHMDAAKHKAFTGKSNELIRSNAAKIARAGLARLIIRVPVIPGFNDTESEIGSIAVFAKSLGGTDAIHLLPYHRLACGKYAALGRDYPMGDTPPPDAAHMARLQGAAQASGLPCVIGG